MKYLIIVTLGVVTCVITVCVADISHSTARGAHLCRCRVTLPFIIVILIYDIDAAATAAVAGAIVISAGGIATSLVVVTVPSIEMACQIFAFKITNAVTEPLDSA